jgi:hypothetical protein
VTVKTELPFSPQVHRRFVITARVGVAIGLVLLVVLLVLYSNRSSEIQRTSIERGQTCTDRISIALDQVLQSVETTAREFAKELESGSIDADNLLERIERDSHREPFLLGLTVAYARDAYPGGGKPLYAPFYDVAAEKMIFCETFYDYTNPARRTDALWYQDALEAFESGLWIAAFGPAAGTTYVGFSLPFRDANGATVGIVNASVSMAKLNDLLNKRFVGRLGGGVMINRDGMLVAHPIFEHVRAGRKLSDVAEEASDPAMLAFATQAGATGEPRRFTRLPSLGANGAGWLFELSVPRAGWRLGIAIFEDELEQESRELRRRRIILILTILATVVLALGLVLRVDRLRDGPMWLFVSSLTLLCLATIYVIWLWTLADAGKIENFQDTNARKGSSIVADRASLDSFLENERKLAADVHRPTPVLIPTGVELRSLRFVDGETVQVGGVIWQTYDDSLHKGLQRSVRIGNVAPDPEALSLEETSRSRIGSKERIVWEFRAALRAGFDYSLYPFDRQRVPLTLSHPAIDKNIVLTPDLDRYAVLNTHAQPGLGKLILPGWTVLGSYFGYDATESTIGFGEAAGRPGRPELHFDVLIQRQVLTPLLSHMLPLLIVAFLLHGVLISSSFNADKKTSSGFSTFGVLETSGAFFFAIVFMHIDLRSSLSLDTITYLEALFVVAYSMLVLVAVNSLVFTETDAVPVLEYRDNLIPKLLYWPLLTGLSLAVTVWIFY